MQSFGALCTDFRGHMSPMGSAVPATPFTIPILAGMEIDMKTLDELRAFCEGYYEGIKVFGDLRETDDWVVWGGYDINFAGREYAGFTYNNDLRVNAYSAGWEGQLPDPLFSFTVGETK